MSSAQAQPGTYQCSFNISLAGRAMRVLCQYRETYRHCVQYLAETAQPDLTIRIEKAEINAMRAAYTVPQPELSVPGVAMSLSGAAFESMILHRRIAEMMPRFDTFLMHGAVVALDGQAYLFAAPSGTGKTTRVMRWLEAFPDSVVVNGDKPLIRCDGQQVLTCGSPWCGKEGWNTNVSVPLRAIFCLERTKDGESNSIELLTARKAFTCLLPQVYQPENQEAMRQTLLLMQNLTTRIAVYRFRSTPTCEAVQLAWKTANS